VSVDSWSAPAKLLFLGIPFLLSFVDIALGSYMSRNNLNNVMTTLMVRARIAEKDSWPLPSGRLRRALAIIEVWGMKFCQGPFSGLKKVEPYELRYFPVWLKRLVVIRLALAVTVMPWFLVVYIASHYR